MKCFHPTVRSVHPTGTGRQQWINRWRQQLNTLAIAFEHRLVAATKYSHHDNQLHQESDEPPYGGLSLSHANYPFARST